MFSIAVFEMFKYTVFMIKIQWKIYWKSARFWLIFQDVIGIVLKTLSEIYVLTTRSADKCPNKKGFTKHEANPRKSKLCLICYYCWVSKLHFFTFIHWNHRLFFTSEIISTGFAVAGEKEDSLYVSFITLSIY